MEAQDLYGLPLEQFTVRRNALARELRREGQRDEAAAVSKLRKPSVAAWAVNQLVRTQRRELDALFNAGDALRQAQADVLAKRGGAASLRKRMQAERAAVEDLTDRARGLLNADGHELTAARLEQVTETLHAAAFDQEARAKVATGCLERELRHIGLGGLGAATAPRARKRRTAGEDRPKARADDRREARKTARHAEAAARRQVEAAARQLRAAERRHQDAAAELAGSEAALKATQKLATRADREHRQAKERLEES